jgi:heme-degrading monooxygenase HmoA
VIGSSLNLDKHPAQTRAYHTAQMPATEYCLFHLVAEGVTEDVKELLEYVQTVQDTWRTLNEEGLPIGRLVRGTGICQQIEDPTVVFLTATWDSAEGHWDWIRSEEQQSNKPKIANHIDKSEGRGVSLFHIDGTLFPPPETDGHPSLLTSPVIGVERFVVDADKKADFEAKFNEIKGIVEETTAPFNVTGGWRIEKDADSSTEEFVVAVGWQSVEHHSDLSNAKDYQKCVEFASMARSVDAKHYKRLI